MKCSSNIDNFFQTSNKPNFPVEYLVTEQGNSCDLGAEVWKLCKTGLKPLFSLKWKKAIPGKLKNTVSLLSFQVKWWEIGKKKGLENSVFRVLKNFVLNWISSIFLKCWVSMRSDITYSLGQKQFCRLYLGDFGVVLCPSPRDTKQIISVYS